MFFQVLVSLHKLSCKVYQGTKIIDWQALIKAIYYNCKGISEVKTVIGRVSLLMVPLTDYCNGKIVNCLFSKTTINIRLAQCSPNCCF